MAAMRTLGTRARDSISLRQRPPVPMQPTLMRSLAPTALTAGTANAAAPAVAAEVFRNERRETPNGVDMRVAPLECGASSPLLAEAASRQSGDEAPHSKALDASPRHGQYRG